MSIETTGRALVSFHRTAPLALGALAIAVATVLACFGADVARDPVGFPVLMAVATAIVLPYLLLFLGSSRLRWSLPIAGSFTVAAVAVAFHTVGPLGVLPAFAASVAVVALCGQALRDRVAAPWADSWGTSLVIAAAVVAMAVLGGLCALGAWFVAVAGC